MSIQRPTTIGALTSAQWEQLEEILEKFEDAWQQTLDPAATVSLASFLPACQDPLYFVVLQELVKAALEIRWRRGQPVHLESYLKQFPDLSQEAQLLPALLYEEYRVRQRYGDRPALDIYRQRFPDYYAQLEQLVQRQPIPRNPAPPLPHAKSSEPERIQRPASPKLVPKHSRLLSIGGGYRLLNRVSGGAFGEVWRAEAPGGVEVAIKIITGSIDQKEAQRELQAVELIKRLRHPFLLSLHAFWQLEDQLVIAMELADRSLRDCLEEHRKEQRSGVPPEELLGYMREAADALDFLHARNVLHRDIKPENILLVGDHIKVADFGLARVVEQSRRLIAASDCGTPAYTAPEVFWQGKVSATSDQYSLAAVYAELRLNRPLFLSRNLFQLMRDHLQRAPELLPLLEAEQRVLKQALAKDPSERFKTCREFVLALERTVPR
jgi:serine/threonine protein kinase